MFGGLSDKMVVTTAVGRISRINRTTNALLTMEPTIDFGLYFIAQRELLYKRMMVLFIFRTNSTL